QYPTHDHRASYEYDHHKNQHHAMSKAEQRRSNKPIMEKRRRARINHCLNELKALILDAMKKDPARHSKLEKADILEMTVKHLQSIQRQQLAVAVATDPTVLHKFKTGFNECASEVSRYISRIEGVEPAVKQRLVAHLANCVSSLQQLSPFTFGTNNINSVFPVMGTMGSSPLHLPLQQGPNNSSSTGLPAILPQIQSGDVNNNHHHNSGTRLQMPGGLQLIPSRLPTGELALLLPNTGQIPGNVLPFFPPPVTTQGASTPTLTTTTSSTPNSGPTSTVTSGSIDRSHPSAFTAVVKSQSPVPSQNRQRSPSQMQQNPCTTRHKSRSPGPVSPTSSVSSCDTTDTFPSPNTPPPNQHPSGTHHHQIHPINNQFKIPLDNPNFKVYHYSIHDIQKPPPSPQQQPLVTSTSSPAMDVPGKVKPTSHPADSSSAIPGTVTEVKLAFKTVPMQEHVGKIPSGNFPPVNSSNNHYQSITIASSTPVDQCLSVITSGNSFLERQMINKDPPLDFSVKKEEFSVTQTLAGGKREISTAFGSSETSSDIIPHSYHSPSKMLRLSFVTNEMSHKSNVQMAPEGLLKCSDAKNHFSMVVEDLSNKPSTSTAVVSTSAVAETSNKDMWRPW
ncbi:hypothetical protein L9F63_024135, partial [Diploptera punctata]